MLSSCCPLVGVSTPPSLRGLTGGLAPSRTWQRNLRERDAAPQEVMSHLNKLLKDLLCEGVNVSHTCAPWPGSWVLLSRTGRVLESQRSPSQPPLSRICPAGRLGNLRERKRSQLEVIVTACLPILILILMYTVLCAVCCLFVCCFEFPWGINKAKSKSKFKSLWLLGQHQLNQPEWCN